MQFTNLFANRTWFDFTVTSGVTGIEPLSVYAFSGTETVSLPYEFSIELVSRNSNLDTTAYLGKPGLLTVADRSGGKRLIHGVIRQMEQLHTANTFTHYRCKLVPRVWFLSQTQDHKIYQHKNVVQIIEEVFQKHNFFSRAYSFNLRDTYAEREYCVQYGETDLHFISRICEEEGIYFYFEHSTDMHCLCFSDAEGGPPIPSENILRFFPGSGHAADTAVVARLNLLQRINSDAATYREWNFTTPNIDLEQGEREPDWNKAPAPAAMQLESYRFPHLYQTRQEGGRYADIQLQRQLTYRHWAEGESDVSRHTPGFTFTLYEHPRADANRGWWIVSVQHEGEQPQVLEHEAPDERGMQYNAKIVVIPDDVRFVPELKHHKVRIEGLQSAQVTGPGGEEVYTDKYGRVKVQFHWDRLGQRNESTTCWVRVADPWAGQNFGFIQVPRIGQEVMVEFMEGDPDRPVITGRVYNENLMPPWHLPEQKTLSGIQSREFKDGRKNQLILDDTQGEIQAQLSSDHNLSQLNLGYLTRVKHVEGRKDFRGEGFELRTDGWGVVRATKGMHSTTHPRPDAQSHQKDFSEGVAGIAAAVRFHKELGDLASKHKAHVPAEDIDPVHSELEKQQKDIAGNGKMHSELAKPHVVVSSAAGIASTAIEAHHMHAGTDAVITAEKNISLVGGKSLLGSFLNKICLFAHKAGVKIFAAMGKVQIQAQSDQMELIAMKECRIVSTKEKVEIAAAKEILLTAGGSYIRINKNGIEQGTANKWVVHAASHSMVGPQTHNEPMLDLPIEGYSRDVKLRFVDSYGNPLPNDLISLSSGADAEHLISTDADGNIFLKNINLNSFSIVQKKRTYEGEEE